VNTSLQHVSSKDLAKLFDQVDYDVMLTPLESIPGAKVLKYLGPINIYFVKEAWGVRNEGTKYA
jgi:hypothetical protein